MTTTLLVCGNAVVDLIFKAKVFSKNMINNRLSLAFGGKYVAEDFFQFYGGGGANAAISLARQNLNTYLWSNLGNDFYGRQISANLAKEKVKIDLLEYRAKHTPISSIFMTAAGERTIVTYRSDADQIKLSPKVREFMNKCQWLVLFSLAFLAKENKLEILKLAKTNHLKTFISLHGLEYKKGLNYLKPYFDYTDILHLNAYELADIFEKKVKDLDFHHTNFAQKLNIPMVLISYDINGNFSYTNSAIYYQPIFKVDKVLDTTGAGDSFSSGFLGKYIKTQNIQEALIFGAKNAASNLKSLGAQNGLLYDK